MNEGWNVIIRYDEDFAGLSIWFIKKEGGSLTVVSPIDMTSTTTVGPGFEMPEPTIKMGDVGARQILQGLVQALVDAGYRPDELKAQDKELDATKFHLEDMRRLVFEPLSPLEVPPPQVDRR